MMRRLHLLLLGASLLWLAVLAARLSPPPAAEATGWLAPAFPFHEYWRLGFTSEGGAAYTAAIGRDVAGVAAFRSSRAGGDIYFIFPPSAETLEVRAIQANVLARSGAYSGTASLAFEVRALSGVLEHVVSAAPLDLEAAPAGEWAGVARSASPADLLIAPGQVLVARATFSEGARDDLDVRAIFEIEVGVPEPPATPTPTATPVTPEPTATAATATVPTATTTIPTATAAPSATATVPGATVTAAPSATATGPGATATATLATPAPTEWNVYLPLLIK